MTDLVSLQGLLAVFLWAALLVYGLSSLWWVVEVTVLSRGWGQNSEEVWGLDDIQVRVLTIDAEPVVQQTVNALPDDLADVRVIAEADISIDGAQVHIVPDEFDCNATNKGRAVEWARRNVDGNKEYLLYLDEDTLVTGLTGLPDADFIQFTEKPIYTGSRLTYLCEVFRTGYQFEQLGFHRLSYPLYAWGGGFAIRREIEQEVGWDVATITEDTNLIWRAAKNRDLTYQLVDARFRNQAPPSLKSMIKQRRRWMSGTVGDDYLLPPLYRPLYFTRVIAWAFSPFVPLLAIASYLLPGTAPGIGLYSLLSTALLGILFVYMLFGVVAYRKHPILWPVFLILTPLAVVLHSVGALWGVVSPVENFEVTEKVTTDVIEQANDLDQGTLAEHEGTDRLLRESDDEFEKGIFTDDD
ncbi:glycosyltransferase family 2 protein [Halorubrum ezzemoulense]|uniref:Glycosyltransferase family 2 protein n=1 Tax=Halorubrum ezzemoulense TaxID=337243 RepID=A0ABT4ZA35_HALEZ|nr:glycosyltransferase family 2 protein [Halorubrum ezzemoulense]MDB2275760.1 glycosyltransferase family 2 protein [Halorubrum ezzemoulense]MDB2294446.1 glycosyltransferase family 2 protein [Halorubrum ezzemoulense]